MGIKRAGEDRKTLTYIGRGMEQLDLGRIDLQEYGSEQKQGNGGICILGRL